MDNEITAKQVRIVGTEGFDVMNTKDALQEAADMGLNLVVMNDPGNGNPPICKFMNYSKYLYDKKKSEKANKKSKIETKEVRISCVCADHDKEVKAKTVERILSEGDNVRIVMPFKGRMIAQVVSMGLPSMEEFETFITMPHSILKKPTVEGNKVFMVVTPPKK